MSTQRSNIIFSLCQTPFTSPCCLLLYIFVWMAESLELHKSLECAYWRKCLYCAPMISKYSFFFSCTEWINNEERKNNFNSFLLNWSLYSIHFVIGHSTSRCANYIYDRIKEIFKFENVNIVFIKKNIPLHPVLWSQWSCNTIYSDKIVQRLGICI